MKDKLLEGKESQIKDGENNLKEKMQLLEERTERLMETEKMLEDKNKEMEETTQQLEEKNKEMEETTQQLEEKNKEMEKMNRQLDEKNKLLQERDTELENITKRERERENLLESMASELETSKRQVQDLRTQLQEQEKELVEREKQLEVERQRCGDVGGKIPGPAAPVSPAVSELRLVLLGGSTAGKRAAGNSILGTHSPTHTSTETQHSESRQGEVAGRRVTVVDTPDWFCSGLSEKDMRQDVGLCVRLSAPGPHAFLLVIPAEPSEGEERKMLEKMEDIFGEDCWRHTLIVFTHAKGLRERNVEGLLQTRSQVLQQLVEKCGNRCHLLNIKDRPDDSEITQLLEKIEEMVSGNRETFYSSETYQIAERQLREIKRRIEEKLRECTKRKEKEIENPERKMKGDIHEREENILAIERKIAELEKELENENNEEKRTELERQLKEEKEKRREMDRLKEDLEKERREMEERHIEELEMMRESYEQEAWSEAEIYLMKIILSELQKNISIIKSKIAGEFRRQMEENKREIERLVEIVQSLHHLVKELEESKLQTDGEGQGD
ncbi:GTPase IMAP family member 8-like [Sardina pilchardus]|uniref:GTPase IMAP family member 8-like n=1 Tax=Sardina pilchardus TaxID=27697 RepID=UPI002E1546E8